MKIIKKYFPLFFIFGIVLALYFPVFSLYFSQDDFFHLNASRVTGSWTGFIRLLGFPEWAERGYAFYRPLFREVYYFFLTKAFGINPLPYRLASFGVHFGCIIMVFVLMKKFFKRRLLAFLTALFYGIATPQIGTFYYHAGGIQASGATLFFLAALYSYWQFLEKDKINYWLLTLGCFLGAIASCEIIVAILPFTLFSLEVLLAKKFSKDWFKGVFFHLFPLGFILVVYLYLDLTLIGLPQDVSYSPVLSIRKISNAFVWYFGWGLGLPDMLVDFVGPGLRLNPKLMLWWGSYFKIIFPAFFLTILMLFFSGVYLFFKNRKIFKNKQSLLLRNKQSLLLRNKQSLLLRNKYFWFLLLWFPIALSPVIILPWHKFLHYLNPALPALFGVVFFVVLGAYDLLKKKNKLVARAYLGLFCFLLFLLSFVSIKLEEKTYWAINRGKIAKNLIEQMKETYPSLPQGAVLYFENDPQYPFIAEEWGGSSTQAYYALSGKDAAQLIYHDPTLKVYYEDIEKPLGPPAGGEEIFSIVARINQK